MCDIPFPCRGPIEKLQYAKLLFKRDISIDVVPDKVILTVRLELRLGDISTCFAWLDHYFSGIWAWCVDSIVDELGIFTLIGFSDGSLVWNIVFGTSR